MAAEATVAAVAAMQRVRQAEEAAEAARAERNRHMLAMADDGMSDRAIAAALGLSITYVRQVRMLGEAARSGSHA